MVIKMSRTIKLVRWACALFFMFLAATGRADVKLLDSFPKSDGNLGESVTDLRLWFDVEPDLARSKVELLNEEVRIPVVALHTMGENDLMGFVRGPTPPGHYRLVWQTSAVGDDKVSSGVVHFTIVKADEE